MANGNRKGANVVSLVLGAKAYAPPGRARWGRNGGASTSGAKAFALWCMSLRSTGASPVGAEWGGLLRLVQKPSLPRRARWGRGSIHNSFLATIELVAGQRGLFQRRRNRAFANLHCGALPLCLPTRLVAHR